MSPKRVCIIGAGASGLTAIKSCFDEGLEPVCFERTHEIGGLWRYTDSVIDSQASVMKSTVINTSKEMMGYSDFPIPKEYAVFMHNTQVYNYFLLYAEKFNLKKCIRFGTEIVSVKARKATGLWDVTWRNCSSDTLTTETFDGVLVCSGHHAMPHVAKFPDMDKFKGKSLHSHDYKNYKSFQDKRVVVVGIGNSGGDIAVELSRVSSQVYLSTRSGSWVWNRVFKNGMPLDMSNITRFANFVMSWIPATMQNSYIEAFLNKRFDHKAYAVKPEHRVLSQHPMVNDDLPNRIISGSVIIKPNIKKFTETGIKFDNDTIAENIDAVILATGYVFGFPFLDNSVVDVVDNKVNLYKHMYPVDIPIHTLAIIGCVQPYGAIMPISELQCRIATRVIKGTLTLPSKSEMWDDVRATQAAMAQRYTSRLRHTIQVDFVPFMDELAILNDCRPNMGNLLLTDPRLAFTCMFGPCTPYQYRIMGPGKWSGARDAVMNAWERTLYPLKTRPVPKSTKFNLSKMIFLCLLGLIVSFLYAYFR